MSRIQRLGDDHLPAVMALHRAAAAAMPPGLMADDGDAFFADHISRLGRTFGVFKDGGLIAYGVLGLPHGDSPNFGADHGLGGADLEAVAHIDGCVVAAAARGQGLQRALTRHRMAEAERLGRRILLSTVAPGNGPSLRNLLACGLTVRGLVEKFGGLRFLLRHDVDGPLHPPMETGEWVAITDLAGQRACLDHGLIGWRLSHDGTALCYAPAQEGNAARIAAARLRRAEASAIIERHAGLAGVGGLVPLAVLDIAAVVTANLSMVKSLAALHGRAADLSEVRTVSLAVAAGLVPYGVEALTVAALKRIIPGSAAFGMLAGSAAAMAVTRLIGEAYDAHFETGAPLTLPRLRPVRRPA